MTIISGPVKSAAYHPDVSEATEPYSASTIDVFEVRPRLSSESEGTAKEAEKEQGYRKAVYWLIPFALVSLVGWTLCLMQSATLQTVGTDQLSRAAGGVPSQGRSHLWSSSPGAQYSTIVVLLQSVSQLKRSIFLH
jgi:hypothetical protein